MSDKSINIYGKVAAFPEPIKPSTAYKYLEHVKINKDKLWYMLIQQQSDVLQMIKYNVKTDIVLEQFGLDLIKFYKEEYGDRPEVLEKLNQITVSGQPEFLTFENIDSQYSFDGKKLITRLVEDLIRLLKDGPQN